MTEESAMIEFKDPVLGYVHYFEFGLVEGNFQYAFYFDYAGTVTIHVEIQPIAFS